MMDRCRYVRSNKLLHGLTAMLISTFRRWSGSIIEGSSAQQIERRNSFLKLVIVWACLKKEPHMLLKNLSDQELIVKTFISSLKEKLWGIPDFQTLLHIKLTLFSAPRIQINSLKSHSKSF